MQDKPRFNITYNELSEYFPYWLEMIIFDRKTFKTLRIKVPARFKQNAVEFFEDITAAVQYSIQSYAKYKHQPQTVELLEEQLYYQRTARYMTQNDFDYFVILNSAIWEG